MSEPLPPTTPPENPKSQTARISLDAARPAAPGTPASAMPHTIRLKRPPTSPITLGALQGPALSAKKATSRIVLESPGATKAAPDARRSTGLVSGIPTQGGPIPQTIRLKRPPTSPVSLPAPDTVPTVKKVAVGAAPVPSTEAPTVAKHLVTPKTSTSRIVLEAVPGPVPGAGESAAAPQPKTIRLKRPSSMPPVAEPGAPETAAPDHLAKKAETSKIELPPDAESAGSITQRKTIKIKRPERNTAMRTVKISAPEEEPAAKPAAAVTRPPEPASATAAPRADPWMIAVSAAAVLCIAALVYIMAVEAVGLAWPLPASLHVH